MNEFFYKYPKGKVLVIQHTNEDILRIEANMFYKMYYESFSIYPIAREDWKQLSNEYFNNIENPLNVPKKWLSHFFSRKSKEDIPYPFNTTDKLADTTAIHYCTFSEILNNKDKMLAMLSSMTGCEITPNIEKAYDLYLDRQQVIMKKIASVYE